jgi:hypothetical protein
MTMSAKNRMPLEKRSRVTQSRSRACQLAHPLIESCHHPIRTRRATGFPLAGSSNQPIRNGKGNALCRQMERLRSLPTSPPSRRHMKNVAFADGEQITHLRGERTWIEVSGFKGDRIFYRKSLLACGGTSWQEVALEYPAEAQSMNGFVDRVAKGVELDQDNGCAAAVATNNGSSNDSEQPPTAENRSSSSVNPHRFLAREIDDAPLPWMGSRCLLAGWLSS